MREGGEEGGREGEWRGGGGGGGAVKVKRRRRGGREIKTGRVLGLFIRSLTYSAYMSIY